MSVDSRQLEIGRSYERPALAHMWGYDSYNAISRGVITPANSQTIILFVTKDKQEALTQYNDFLDGKILFWEGEKKHGTDRRIINAQQNSETIYLFYRDRHHRPFIYYGPIRLMDYTLYEDKPSRF